MSYDSRVHARYNNVVDGGGDHGFYYAQSPPPASESIYPDDAMMHPHLHRVGSYPPSSARSGRPYDRPQRPPQQHAPYSASYDPSNSWYHPMPPSPSQSPMSPSKPAYPSPPVQPPPQCGDDAELQRALQLSTTSFEFESAQRRSEEEAQDRQAKEEWEAEQLQRLEEREREERELAEAMRMSEVEAESSSRREDPDLDLALAMSLSLSGGNRPIQAPVASSSRLQLPSGSSSAYTAPTPAPDASTLATAGDAYLHASTDGRPSPRPSVRTEMRAVMERRKRVDDERRQEQQRRISSIGTEDLSRAGTVTSTTANVGVGSRPRPVVASGMITPQLTGGSLPPPYEEAAPAYTSESTPPAPVTTAAPAPAPARVSPPPAPPLASPPSTTPASPPVSTPSLVVPTIMRPLPDLPKPTMQELRPQDRRPLIGPPPASAPITSGHIPAQDTGQAETASIAPSMPSLQDEEVEEVGYEDEVRGREEDGEDEETVHAGGIQHLEDGDPFDDAHAVSSPPHSPSSSSPHLPPASSDRAKPSPRPRQQSMDLWAHTHDGFSYDDEEDEDVRAALQRGRRPSDPDESAESLGLDEEADEEEGGARPSLPTMSPSRPTRPPPPLPTENGGLTTLPASGSNLSSVTLDDRPPGFVENPTAPQELLSNVSYGFPFLAGPGIAGEQGVTAAGEPLSEHGSFPDVVALSRFAEGQANACAGDSEGERAGGRTVFAIEAPTWNRLLAYCMWHGRSRIEAAPLDVAESSVPLEMALTVRFTHTPPDRMPFVRVFLELVAPLSSETPASSTSPSARKPSQRRRQDLGGHVAISTTPLNQTIAIPKPYVELPLTLSALGATLHEINKVARLSWACSGGHLVSASKPTPNGELLQRLAKAIEANADYHGEGKTMPAAQEGETLIRRGKRWLRRTGKGLVGHSGGDVSKRVEGDGLPLPVSFITPFDSRWG